MLASKPTHAILMVPIGLLMLARREWGRLVGIALAWTLLTGGLFMANAAITGEFNYQGGDRKTFYSYLGFPFANGRETFDNIGPPQRLEAVLRIPARAAAFDRCRWIVRCRHRVVNTAVPIRAPLRRSRNASFANSSGKRARFV